MCWCMMKLREIEEEEFTSFFFEILKARIFPTLRRCVELRSIHTFIALIRTLG